MYVLFIHNQKVYNNLFKCRPNYPHRFNAIRLFQIIAHRVIRVVKAEFGTAFLSNITNLIEIVSLSNLAPCRLKQTACCGVVHFHRQIDCWFKRMEQLLNKNNKLNVTTKLCT